MPEPEKKEKKEPNEYYESLMFRANNWLQESTDFCGLAQSSGEELRNQHLNTAKDFLAMSLAYAQLAGEYGFGEPKDFGSEDDPFRKRAEKLAPGIRKSPKFVAVFGAMDGKQLRDFISVKNQKDGRWKSLDASVFAQKYDEREKEAAPQIRMGNLVDQLENSTHKSFTGTLKNIFAGNSKQYEAAFKAMQDLAQGKAQAGAERDNAKKAIKDYILARGGKERDHEYGRDRFNAFMKGLSETMDAKEFMQTCAEVNQMRERTYGGSKAYNIKATDYFMTEEKKQAYLAEEKKVLAAAKAERHRDSVLKATDDELAKAHARNERDKEIEKLSEEEQTKTSTDERNILRDAKTISDGVKVSKDKTLPQRDQDYLNWIRRSAQLVNNPAEQSKINGLRDKLNERFREHPALRLVAGKLIQDKGLQNVFPVPETYTRKMSPEATDALEKQVKDLQAQDRNIHPEDPIEDVQVKDMAPKKLEKLEKINAAEDLEEKQMMESAPKLAGKEQSDDGIGFN